MPTIRNRNTGASWLYSGPFNDGDARSIFVLDHSGKVIEISTAYSGPEPLKVIYNTVYEVTFDIVRSPVLEKWLDYQYSEIAYLFNQTCSDLHKIQNRNIKFRDPRGQMAVKYLRKEIDKVREKVKASKQLTQLEQKVYDLVLSRYNFKTTSNIVPSKSLPHLAIEIMYNVTINTNI